MMVNTRKGVRFAVDNIFKNYLPPIWYVRFHTRTWRWRREPELSLLQDLVPSGRNSIDVGASWGVYTHSLSRLCQHVFSYEPHPEVFEKLRKSLGTNVNLFQLALSDRNGVETLYVPNINGRDADGLSRLSRDFTEYRSRTIEVSTVRLDDQDHSDVGFMKIDVEGHEIQVLQGAKETLLRERPTLLIEIEERHVRRPIRNVFRMIEDIGYIGYFFANGSLRHLNQFSPEEHQHPSRIDMGSPAYIRDFIFKPHF